MEDIKPNWIYTRRQMRELNISTDDYCFMSEAGFFFGRLDLRAEAKDRMLRLFITLDDGRKIITPVFWWQNFVGFYEIKNGTRLKFHYVKNGQNKIYLKDVEIAEGY